MRHWLGAAVDWWRMGAEASLVVPLRLARLARGGKGARDEARLMVREKVEAQALLLRAYRAGELGSGAGEVTRGVVSHCLEGVRANRRRLMREFFR
jgi:hypothetical protein